MVLIKEHETSISTVQNPAQTPAWLFEPQFFQKRTRHPAQPAPRGPQTPHTSLTPMDPSPEVLGLARSRRLKRQSDFAKARALGRRCVSGCLIANVRDRADGQVSRIGVVTSKKIGNAVQRSRARRLLRETFRLHQHQLEGAVDVVLVARFSIARKKFSEVERDFLRALRQARVLQTPKIPGGGQETR